MSSIDSLLVTITNWSKYKGRKDNKHNTWFRCSNGILEDPELFDFSGDELKVWIYILSTSSKKNAGQVLVLYAHIIAICRISRLTVTSAILKLYRNRSISIDQDLIRSLKCELQTPESPLQTDRQTDINKQTNNISANSGRPPSADQVVVRFDFESVYKTYPRKEGKKAGLSKLKSIIKSEQDLKNFQDAIDRYKKVLIDKKTEARYVLKFSTFVNNWTDWLDDDAGTVEGFSSEKKSSVDAWLESHGELE